MSGCSHSDTWWPKRDPVPFNFLDFFPSRTQILYFYFPKVSTSLLKLKRRNSHAYFIYLFIYFLFNLGCPFNALALFFHGSQVALGHTNKNITIHYCKIYIKYIKIVKNIKTIAHTELHTMVQAPQRGLSPVPG